MTAPTDTELDRQIDELLAMIRQNPEIKATEIGWESFDETLAEAKAQIKQLIARERLDELKLATVGRVTNKNKKNLTYMSGFGYAANNLQEHKNTRLTALQAQADKKEQG